MGKKANKDAANKSEGAGAKWEWHCNAEENILFSLISSSHLHFRRHFYFQPEG